MLTVKTPASQLILTLAEAKEHLKVSHSQEDGLIDTLMAAAQGKAESYTGRTFMETVFTESFCCFCKEMPLTAAPLASVASVKYYNESDVLTTVATTVYEAQTGDYGQVIRRHSQEWPTDVTTERARPIVIEYTAGTALPIDVDARLKAAVLLILGYLYENREDAPVKNSSDMPRASKWILDGYKIQHV